MIDFFLSIPVFPWTFFPYPIIASPIQVSHVQFPASWYMYVTTRCLQLKHLVAVGWSVVIICMGAGLAVLGLSGGPRGD